jgi:hypothetical protein
MKATYITFLCIIIFIACFSNTEPLTNQPVSADAMKQEHKGILNNIVKSQNVEQQLYNNLKTKPNQTTNIINSINKLSDYRNTLFDKLLTESNTAINVTPKMEQENQLFGEINDELGKMKQQLSLNKNKKYENMKMAEINNYYNERSKAYVSFFKFLFYCSIPLLIISVLMKQNILPIMYGNVLIGIVLFFTIFWGGARYYDIISRNNMNFDEYDLDWEFDTGGTAPGGFEGSLFPAGCIDENCCAKGTIYDKSKGVCVIPSSQN